jgi:hypothetical protein
MMRSMTGRQLFMTGYRLLFAALTVAAIITQFVRSSDLPTFNPVNFFSYFTIWGNLFATAVFAYGAYRLALKNDPPSATYNRLRGANTLYMAVVGIVFALLLSGVQAQLDSNIRWVNTVLHYIMPVVVVADWIFEPPELQLAFRDALLWLIVPLIYLGYSLLRGPAADWYPYPFLDVQLHGYDRVLRTCGVIAIGATVAGYAIVALGNELRSRRRPAVTLGRSVSG